MRLGVCIPAFLWVLGCGGAGVEESQAPTPLPTAGIAGQPVAVFPLTLIAAEESLGWTAALADRNQALRRADSLIAAYLTERNPEVRWILPDELRRAAARAPGVLPDPDRMGTALLRASNIARVPDPLWSQLRSLTGVVGDRYAAIPAALVFRPIATEAGTVLGRGTAELAFVLLDVRRGLIGWRTVAKGEGEDPWSALREALRTFAPDVP
jgi:hypothetical protein